MEQRVVNMVLQAKGLRDDPIHLAEVSSLGSGMESVMSDLEDPLHDESILQQLFYSQVVSIASTVHFKSAMKFAKQF